MVCSKHNVISVFREDKVNILKQSVELFILYVLQMSIDYQRVRKHLLLVLRDNARIVGAITVDIHVCTLEQAI